MTIEPAAPVPEFLKSDSPELHELIGRIACRSAEVDQIVLMLYILMYP